MLHGGGSPLCGGVTGICWASVNGASMYNARSARLHGDFTTQRSATPYGDRDPLGICGWPAKHTRSNDSMQTAQVAVEAGMVGYGYVMAVQVAFSCKCLTKAS
jgi:hypothetical protein